MFGEGLKQQEIELGVACSDPAIRTALAQLTDAGYSVYLSIENTDPPAECIHIVGAAGSTVNDILPRWDRERRTLYVGDQVVKQFREPSPNQEAVLAAFHQEGWAYRIDDPLPHSPDQDPKYRLHHTIHRLNHNQRQTLIRFRGDGTGQGVCWELTEVVPLAFPSIPVPKSRRRAA
jgi:hypothetical protein